MWKKDTMFGKVIHYQAPSTTALLLGYSENLKICFDHNKHCITFSNSLQVDSSPCVLEILDTAGTEQFASMRDLYIKNGHGFIVMYSLTNHQTFQVNIFGSVKQNTKR